MSPAAVAAGGARAVRLAPAVEAFPAPDGALYLLRDGLAAELVIRRPSPFERALFEALDGPATTLPELAGALGVAEGELAPALAQLEALGLLAVAAPDGPLDAEERERFARQLPYLGEVAEERQARLRDAQVAVVGCGGLGSWALAALACAGVGGFLLVDDDTVELSNLNRQLLFRRADVGRAKVEVAAEAIRAFNPAARVRTLQRRVAGPADAEACVDGADAVVETADWPPYEIGRWIDGACRARAIPHLSAGQMPPLVRVGPLFVPGVTACFECQERRARSAFPFYDALVAFRRDRPSPATTLGPASGVIGSLIAMELFHLLTGAFTPATLGRALVLDLATGAARFDVIERDPACGCAVS